MTGMEIFRKRGVAVACLVVGVATASGVRAQDLPLNPAVTQATIGKTICVAGWTKTVRPPFEVSTRIKSELLRRVGLTDADKSRFELDHVIPLSLGGAPSDLRNLRLQPWSEAAEKDRVEECLPRAVCEGQVTLDRARAAIWSDWRAASSLCSPSFARGVGGQKLE